MNLTNIKAYSRKTRECEIITDLYWFEENGVHSIFNGIGEGYFDTWDFCYCVGMKDSDGVDVYGGDVIDLGKGRIANIFYSANDFKYIFHNPLIGDYSSLTFLSGYKKFKVIGNIHQHPHLLGE